MKTAEFDTVIVGAGPAGLFAALRAGSATSGEVLLVDAGLDIETRLAVRSAGRADSDIGMWGFGGTGLFSGGKLRLAAGGQLQQWVDEILTDGQNIPLFQPDESAAARLEVEAAARGLDLVRPAIRQFDARQLVRTFRRLRVRVAESVRIRCETTCTDIRPTGSGGWELALTGRGYRVVRTRNVVLAVGKAGSRWLDEVGERLALRREPARPGVGFRLEGPEGFLAPLPEVSGEPEVVRRTGGTLARAYGLCHGGDVVLSKQQGLTVVSGRPASVPRSNCAVTASVTQGPSDAAAAARAIVAASNSRHGTAVFQRLVDFLGIPRQSGCDGMRFEPSLPTARHCELSELLPGRTVGILRSFLFELCELLPAVAAPANRLYGLAVDGWSSKFAVNPDWSVPGWNGLFLVGHCGGAPDGIVGAAKSGWIAAGAILGDEAGIRRPEVQPAGWRA